MSTVLEVNGVGHVLTVDGDTPLLYCLRDDLKLKGTRFGCGSGHCGACTVLVDDRAVQSCDTPLWAAAGHRVTTVEGLAGDGIGALLRQAFIDEQAAQCGYCINGILMSVTALLKADARPARAAILKALERNLCRCGTQVRILRAIDRAIGQLHAVRA